MDHGPMATDMGDPIREAEEYVSRSIHPAPPGSIMSFVACTLSQLLARSSGQTGGSVLHASAELGRSILCGRALDAADPSRASARGRGGFRTSFVEGPLDARPPFTPQPGTGQDASTYHAFQAPTGVGAGAGASDADANADADANICFGRRGKARTFLPSTWLRALRYLYLTFVNGQARCRRACTLTTTCTAAST
ncbi:hypothetical protein DCS_07414 [Drechmeria coniospora]|uniref:Uncharacterized protein n=1 Tax=Drechmeria coniospora TaxID=98403 RepID=A0A151GEF4_DRECN|nr:hypothetical protein DCS_07414 [Drechmeria coniospora]KYK55451.1 hypothetical protein DCS_07414 [Drechmeria coniospora]